MTRYLTPLLIFLIMVIFLWQGLKINPTKLSSPLIGKPLLQFVSGSLNNPAIKINSQQLRGHVVLLNVWASWCISCQAEHPVLMDIARSHKVQLYGLNYKDQRAAAEKWLKLAGDPYVANIYDPQGQIGINLGVYGTPETFLIDQNGIIRYKYVGPISPEAWQHELLPQIERIDPNLGQEIASTKG